MIRSAPVDDYQPPHDNFADFFINRTDGDSIYLIELDHDQGTRREWTVDEWRSRVFQTAEAFDARGTQPGDCVSALLGNRAEALVVAYACWIRGICYVPLSAHDTAERQSYILRDCDARFLIIGANQSDETSQLQVDTEFIDFESLLGTAAGGQSVPAGGSMPKVTLDTDMLRVYTSGTTGDPKGVILTSRSVLTDCDALAIGTGYDSGTRLLTVLPIHHVNGLIIGSLLMWFVQGSTVLCDRFRTDEFWTDAANEEATGSSLVPTLLEFLLQSEGSPTHLLDEVLCGAGPLLPETAAAFESRFGVPIRHLFGMSETSCVVTLMPRMDFDTRGTWHSEHGFPSIGPALPHAAVEVHDANGSALPANERGELVVRGGMVMRGYSGRRISEDSSWLHTGDEGFWLPADDGKPYFFITGRIKELIIRGGVNIAPVEIDAVLNQHPAVTFGLAFPFSNRFYGEEVAAYVAAGAGVTERELIEYCAERLDFSMCPKVVIFGDEIPFTSTGKPKRIELARNLSQQLEQFRNTQFRRSDALRAR